MDIFPVRKGKRRKRKSRAAPRPAYSPFDPRQPGATDPLLASLCSKIQRLTAELNEQKRLWRSRYQVLHARARRAVPSYRAKRNKFAREIYNGDGGKGDFI